MLELVSSLGESRTIFRAAVERGMRDVAISGLASLPNGGYFLRLATAAGRTSVPVMIVR
jgi:hypothetical protein